MTELRHGSLFSGTGALDDAVRAVLGGRQVFVADHYIPARRVLAREYPDARLYGDIAAIDWTTAPAIDVLTAGFPCTDMSLLGRREGLTPDRSDRHLFDTPSGWELTVRAARALEPGLIVLENVSAILTAEAGTVADGRPGTALGVVLSDLAELGFDAEWLCADASAAGAPHRRRRWFLAAADPERFRRGPRWDGYEPGQPGRLRGHDAPGGPVAAHWAAEPVWQDHGPALERWALTGHGGRGAPEPVLDGGWNPELWAWLMGHPAGRLTSVGLSRPEVQRLAGNGVVPQQALRALPVLLDRLSLA